MMQVNPFQVIGMIKNGQNPQQIIMNLLEQQNSSPMYKSLKNMIHNNKIDEIEDFEWYYKSEPTEETLENDSQKFIITN